MSDEHIEMAKWDRAYINSLPNSSFAVIEPDYLSGKTDNKNARHLPYKDSSGKVDLPHLRNALARVNQIKPVTKSISASELRAKAKKVLEAAAKKHLPSHKNENGQRMSEKYECECLDCGHKFSSEEHCADTSCPKCGGDTRRAERPGDGKEKRNEAGMRVSEEFKMSLSNGKLGKFEFLEDKSDDSKRVMRFELMDNRELYNGVRFTADALRYQADVFNEGKFKVTHGMDHSGNVRDQIGLVTEMSLEEVDGIVTAFIVSEHFKETLAQREAETLYKQGLLDSISGGWSASIAFNENSEEYEVYKPILREVSSTPVPAKKDATAIENVCMALRNYSPTNVNDEEKDEIPKEEFDMPDDENTPETPEVTVEQSAEFTALKVQADANAKKLEELQASQEASVVASLMDRAAELGLPAEDFENKSPEAIRFALGVANKVRMSTLRENNPDIPLGDNGETQELTEREVIDTYYDFDLE